MLFLVASEIPYKFATYFYRREFTRLYFCHIVDIVDKGCREFTCDYLRRGTTKEMLNRRTKQEQSQARLNYALQGGGRIVFNP